MSPAAPRIRYGAQPSTAELVVVGGGIVGAATAFFAARAGLRTVVLERGRRLAGLTTPASAGAFRLQFDNPEELGLVREGVELFDAWPERSGLAGWDLGVRHQGYLFAALTDDGVERGRAIVGRQRGWGLTDVELLDGDEARARFPYLAATVRGARFRAGDGWLEPLRLAAGYATAASHAERIPDAEPGGGATFSTGAGVIGLERAGDRIVGVRTAHGVTAAEHVVIAAGPFTASVTALAGLRLDLRPTRRQKLVFPELPEVRPDAPMTIEEETAAHWRPAWRGCFALWTEADTPPDEPRDEVPIDRDWALGLLDPSSGHALARVTPFWRAVWERGTDPWYLQAGQYEYTPDRRPYLGPSGIEGLSINGGYSGHGIMASAAGSRVVVDLLLGRGDPRANPFRVDRPMLERPLDIL